MLRQTREATMAGWTGAPGAHLRRDALRWIAACIDLGTEGDVASLDLDITVSSEPVAAIRDHTGTLDLATEEQEIVFLWAHGP